MKKLIPILLVLILAGGGGVWYYRAHQSAPPATTIRLSGNIEVTEVEASFRIPGRVISILVAEGDTVRAGDTIARLDDTELRSEEAMRAAEVGSAAATLAELEAGTLPEEIAAGAAAVSGAQAEADRLRSDLARQRELLAREVISQREYEATEAAARIAQGRLTEAQQRLALLRQGPRRERIDSARARLDQAAAGLDLVHTRLDYTVLTAPASGMVLTKRIEAGEYVAAGTPVLTIGDLGNAWLRAYLDETDLGRVRFGQPVRIFSDSFRDRVFAGTITFISSEAEFTPRSVQTEKERVKLVYRIKVTVPNARGEFKPGMPVSAEIEL